MALSKYNNPLIDYDFLKRLDNEKQRETFAKIIALDWDENPLEEITGRVTGGSANIDGTSAVRRTCSLTLVAEELNLHDYYWGLNTKFKLFVGLRNHIDERYEDIIWFPLGTYVIASFSTSQSTNNYNVNIQGKDKMCLLNGELGGVVNSLTWDFGTYDEISADGTIVNKDNLLKDIIIEAVHEFAKEPYHNIVVNDLDTFGVELMEYRGSDTMYMLSDQSTLEVSQMTLDGNTSYPYYKREKDAGWKNGPIKLKDIEKTVKNDKGEDITVGYDNNPEAAYDTGTDRLSVETNHILVSSANNGSKPIYSVIKAEYGTVVGYRVTDLTYAGDLIAQVGNPITTAVLDKIKSMLGEFEYFYDIDGRFIFQKKKTYISTSYSGLNKNDDEDQWFNNIAESSAVTYYFEDGQIITSFSNQPNLANLRNDFSIWGVRKSVSGNEIPVHMRYAIDKKPLYYTTYDGSVTYTVRTEEEVEKDMERGFTNVAVGYQKTPNPIFAEGKEPLSEDWWNAKDWAEYYKECTGAYPKATIGTYTESCSNLNYSKYFAQTYKNRNWNDIRPISEETETNSTDTIFTKNGIFYAAHGKCGHGYEQHLIEWQESGQDIYVYKPELPEEILKQEGVELVPLGSSVKYECEWRELIYQMARDNMSYGHRDDFMSKIAQNNPYHYPSGQTGYEQYYTDILSFWRQIYDPSYLSNFEQVFLSKNTFEKSPTKYWKAQRCEATTPYQENQNWLKKVGVNQEKYDTVAMTREIWNNKLTPIERTYYYLLVQCRQTGEVFSSKTDYFVQNTTNFVSNGWAKEVALYPEMLNFWFDFLDAKEGDLDQYSVQNVGIRPKAENDTNVKAIYFRDTPNVIFVDTTKISKVERSKKIENYGSEQEWRTAIKNNLTDAEKEEYKVAIGKTTLSNDDIENLVTSKQALELKLAVDSAIQDQKEEMPGYTFIRLPTYMENMFSISAQGKSAFDKLDNWLYSFAYCTESISVSALPVYYLQPNTRIFVKDENSNIEGEYIVNRISLPLTYNGMMSISATKAVQRLY